MFSKTYSGTILGVEPIIITVEADVSNGLPVFLMVGLLGSEVKEARERVKISIKNAGFDLKPKRITVNLSPADIRKEGTAFDLPIAIAILSSYGFIIQKELNHTLLVGELGLNGSIHRVNGVLPIVYHAMKQGFKRCLIPKDNLNEASIVNEIEICGISSLKEAVGIINEGIISQKFNRKLNQNSSEKYNMDFNEIRGQDFSKRAIEVAAAGMHNILMVGPPGSGKTMIAQRIVTILPELTFEEAMDTSKIYSILGMLKDGNLMNQRPFRNPHHTITKTALIGGGKIPKPGELSLAHNGILFLDELTEFRRETIEVLRQPLEEGYINISRVFGNFKLPTKFILVSAMNPCNCGYYPDRNKCNCSIHQIQRYISKISKPLIDRFDISTEVLRVEYLDLKAKGSKENSFDIKRRVEIARQMQIERYKGKNINYNSELKPKEIDEFCRIGIKEQRILELAFMKMNLSARGYHRVLKVARTIADLEESNEIKVHHISEAISYRGIDGRYWGSFE